MSKIENTRIRSKLVLVESNRDSKNKRTRGRKRKEEAGF